MLLLGDVSLQQPTLSLTDSPVLDTVILILVISMP